MHLLCDSFSAQYLPNQSIANYSIRYFHMYLKTSVIANQRSLLRVGRLRLGRLTQTLGLFADFEGKMITERARLGVGRVIA
jgi:hypothetical protein